MPAMDREGLSGALEAISDGRASGLVVARMDRLARLLVESETALALVWNFGGSMFSVDSGEVQRDESDEPLVRALQLIVATIGELERNTSIVRMRHKVSQLARAWRENGDLPCEHPKTDKEYHLGSDTVDVACLVCGATWQRGTTPP